jgi:hypothetical protein
MMEWYQQGNTEIPNGKLRPSASFYLSAPKYIYVWEWNEPQFDSRYNNWFIIWVMLCCVNISVCLWVVIKYMDIGW